MLKALMYRNHTGYLTILYQLPVIEDYRLIVERRFARPNDPESYAGGSVSTW
jgi:hypothetical protein